MAVRSITVPASHIYQYRCDSNYKHFYKNLTADSISLGQGLANSLMIALAFPDMTETLGQHVLYGIKPTFRIATSKYTYSVGSSTFTEQFPVEDPGNNEVEAPKAAIPEEDYGLSANQELFTDGPHADPGANITINYRTNASDRAISKYAFQVLKSRGIYFSKISASDLITGYRTLLNGNVPYITVFYDDEVFADRSLMSVSGPTSGYNNPRTPTLVNGLLWFTPGATYSCLDRDLYAVRQTIYWKTSSESTWHTYSEEVQTIGNGITVPANTFPANSTIQWYLVVEDNVGITTTSDTFSFTTIDSTSTAIPVSPVNSVEIGNTGIEFTWSVENETGEPPSRVKAEWATASDAETWTSLFDFSSAVYSFTAEPNTFPGGNIYWRVTSYNADGVIGPTSDIVVFSCVAPPSPPTNVTCDDAPFLTIRWQSEVQTAYEISIDGIVTVKKFGTGIYSYQLTEPLSDGQHEIAVRVQGAYGYWSTPTVVFTNTVNTGTGIINVEGYFDIDGNIVWTYDNMQENIMFRVYRDDRLIAKTANMFFTDRFVLGTHSYRILAELIGGTYCMSETISGTMRSCTTRIALAEGGNWQELTLSENSNSIQNFEWNRDVTMRHYAGAVYPVAEFSSYEDRVASYDCTFSDLAEATAFEKLKGKIVILKSRGSEVVIGPLVSLSKAMGGFYIAYHFSLQQIHWEDFIDDTNS